MLVGKSTKMELDNMCLSGRVGECLKTKGECGSEVEEKVLTSAGRSWVWLLAKRRATWAPETSDPPGLRLDNHGNHVRVSWAEEEDAWYDWNCTHGRFLLLSISVDIHQHPFPIMMSAPYCQVGGFQSISKWIFHFLHQIHQLHILSCRHLLEDFPGDKQTPGELRWPLWRHFEEGVQMGREVQPHGRSQFKTGGGGGEPFGRETKWGGRPYQVHMCPSAPSQSHPGAPLLWWGRSTKVLLGSFFLYLSDQVVTPSLLLFWFHTTDWSDRWNVLPEPKPSDALDLALLQLCLSTKPSLKAAGLGQPLWWVFKSFHGVHNLCISGEQALWNKVSAEILQSIPSRTSVSAAQRKYKMRTTSHSTRNRKDKAKFN